MSLKRKKRRQDDIEDALIDEYEKQLEEALRLSLQEREEEKRVENKSMCGPIPWYSVTTNNKPWQNRVDLLPDVTNICFRECGQGGDCMFYSIAYSYLTEIEGETCPSDACPSLHKPMKEVRKWLANSVTMDNVDEFIHYYQQEKFATEQNIQRGRYEYLSWPNTEDYPETWNPFIFPTTRPLIYTIPNTRGEKIQHSIKVESLGEKKRKYFDPNYKNFAYFNSALTPEELKGMTEIQKRRYSAKKITVATVRNQIEQEGWVFQGDSTALTYLAQGDNPIRTNSIGFLILSNQGHVQCDIIPEHQVRDHYMLLYHVGGHWQLAGFALQKDQVRSIFRRQELPTVFRILYNQDCGDRFYNFLL